MFLILQLVVCGSILSCTSTVSVVHMVPAKDEQLMFQCLGIKFYNMPDIQLDIGQPVALEVHRISMMLTSRGIPTAHGSRLHVLTYLLQRSAHTFNISRCTCTCTCVYTYGTRIHKYSL